MALNPLKAGPLAAVGKAIGRRMPSSPADQVDAEETQIEKAPAKKPAPAAKKTPAKKTPAKKAPAKRAPASSAQKADSNLRVPVEQPAMNMTATSRSTRKASSAAKKGTSVPAAKTTTTPVLAVKDGEQAWTKAELEELLSELREQRDHSLKVLADQEEELSGLMRNSGDGAGLDQADVGASSFERDQELTVVNSERDKLAQIERALDRIDNGTYGVCESCGEPIGKMRLMAFPRATLCMTCKQREERR